MSTLRIAKMTSKHSSSNGIWRKVQLSHMHQSRLSALRSSHVCSSAVVHLVHGIVGRVGIRRVGIHIAGVVLRRGGHVRG